MYFCCHKVKKIKNVCRDCYDVVFFPAKDWRFLSISILFSDFPTLKNRVFNFQTNLSWPTSPKYGQLFITDS